jgi:hypothetical protein
MLFTRALPSRDRQMRGFPAHDAAGNLADLLKSAALQQTRGDG